MKNKEEQKKIVCKYDTNLRYKGDLPEFSDEEMIWNCTDFARDMEGNFLYVIQPLYVSGEMHGYTGLQVLVLTESQLIKNFVVIEDNKEYNIKSAALTKEELSNIRSLVKRLYAEKPDFNEY